MKQQPIITEIVCSLYGKQKEEIDWLNLSPHNIMSYRGTNKCKKWAVTNKNAANYYPNIKRKNTWNC